MSKSRLGALCGAMAILVALAAPAGAVIIDDFESGPVLYSCPPAGFDIQTGPAGSIIGAERRVDVSGSATVTFVWLQDTAGDDAVDLHVSDDSPDGGDGQIVFTYDGVGAGELNADLTVGGHGCIIVELEDGSGDGTATLAVEVYTDQGTGHLEKTFVSNAAFWLPGGNVEFAYADFSLQTGTALNFAHVDKVVVDYSAVVGANIDYAIIDIRTAVAAGGGDPVPEPAGLGLIGLAMLGMRRRRN
jgi:MYXO-CTERM domain-containing protein